MTTATLVLRRFAFAAYGIFLTLLLIVPDPLRWLGLSRLPSVANNDKLVHFTTFALLGLLIGLCHWPVRKRTLVLLAVGYAALSEGLQYFSPPRTVDFFDWLCNVTGLAVGGICYVILHRAAERWRSRRARRAADTA